MWIIIACYAMTALTFVFGKKAVQLAHPLFVIGARMIAAGLLLFCWILIQNPRQLKVARSDLWRFGRVAIFHIYLAFTCEFWALGILPSSQVNLIYSTTPFVAAGFSYWLKGERLSKRKLMALCLGLGGMLPVVFSQSSSDSASSTPLIVAAQLALATSVISASYAWFDIEILMQSYSILLINAQAMLFGGLGSLISVWLVAGKRGFVVEHPAELIAQIGALILLSNILFYNLFGWLLQRHSLTMLTFAGLLSPLFGAFYGSVLMGETIDWRFGLSLVLLAAALGLFFQEEWTSQ